MAPSDTWTPSLLPAKKQVVGLVTGPNHDPTWYQMISSEYSSDISWIFIWIFIWYHLQPSPKMNFKASRIWDDLSALWSFMAWFAGWEADLLNCPGAHRWVDSVDCWTLTRNWSHRPGLRQGPEVQGHLTTQWSYGPHGWRLAVVKCENIATLSVT